MAIHSAQLSVPDFCLPMLRPPGNDSPSACVVGATQRQLQNVRPARVVASSILLPESRISLPFISGDPASLPQNDTSEDSPVSLATEVLVDIPNEITGNSQSRAEDEQKVIVLISVCPLSDSVEFWWAPFATNVTERLRRGAAEEAPDVLVRPWFRLNLKKGRLSLFLSRFEI